MLGGDFDGPLLFSWPDEEWDYEEVPERLRGRSLEAVQRHADDWRLLGTVQDLSELYRMHA